MSKSKKYRKLYEGFILNVTEEYLILHLVELREVIDGLDKQNQIMLKTLQGIADNSTRCGCNIIAQVALENMEYDK